jgi:pyruvate ferredoxin oxidoreductase beta subunit
MDRFSVYVPKLLPSDEYFLAGRRSCQGCGKAMAARIASKAVGPAGVVSGSFARSHYPFTDSLAAQSYTYDDVGYENMTTRLSSAIRQINELRKDKARAGHKRVKKAVVGIDRRLFMSDFLVLAEAFERGEDTLYVCYDNEPYIDKLIQKTYPKAFSLVEVHHPMPGEEAKQVVREKNIPPIVQQMDFSYVATACVSYPFDYIEKVKKGFECSGNAFISVLCPCPTRWLFDPKLTVKVGLSAVRTGYFPLYEIEGGSLKVTQRVSKRKPLAAYLKMQKRFMLLSPAFIPPIQEAVEEVYQTLLGQAKA